MEKVSRIASYLLNRYHKQYGEIMDEIKLQKLFYCTQKEAIIRTGQPMFDAEFRAWKYGPVITEIHERYQAPSCIFYFTAISFIIIRYSKSMRITTEQNSILENLTCERLSSNINNMRLVDDFFNRRNSSLEHTIQNEAMEEDEEGSMHGR